MMDQKYIWIIIIIVILIIIATIILTIVLLVRSRQDSKQNSNPQPRISIIGSCNPKTSDCHKLIFINNCGNTIYIGALGNAKMKSPGNGGWILDTDANKEVIVYIPKKWAGRFWARTGCDAQGQNCATGDCGALHCEGKGGKPNVTLIEFTFDSSPTENIDFYDVSNVDAYNMSIKIEPISGTYQKRNTNNIYDCGSPGCKNDVDLSKCPEILQIKNEQGEIVACLSPCQKINTDQTCCRGKWGTSSTCKPSEWPSPYNDYVTLVKTACPTIYSYPYDDSTSTFSCQSLSDKQLTGYTITFCSA